MATATLKESFNARCAMLGDGPDAAARVLNARFAAVEAYVDAAMSLLPDDAQSAANAIREAEEQFERASSECLGDAADAASSESLTEMDRLVRGARLRAGLCSGDPEEAWRVFSDCLGVACVESLPLPSRLDLAASLIMAGMDGESEVVTLSLRTAIASGASPQAIVAEGLATLHACGVPGAVITRIREAIGVGGGIDEER